MEGLRVRHHPEERTDNAVDAGLDHHPREEGADRGRRNRMCVRKPELAERKHAGLEGEAEKDECVDDIGRRAGRRAELSGKLVHGIADAEIADEDGAGEDERPGDLHQDEVLVRIADVLRLLVFEAHQEERCDGHHLPGDGEAHREVVHGHDPEHPRDEDGEVGIITPQPVVRVVLHVGDRIEGAHDGHEADDAGEEARKAVEQEVDLDRPEGDELGRERVPAEDGLVADAQHDDGGSRDHEEIEPAGERPLRREEGRHDGGYDQQGEGD